MTKPAPDTIHGARVICYSPIDERHTVTGNCQHIVDGRLRGAMPGLAICQYPGANDFYLFSCDADWSTINDSWHPTLDDALHQAEFEYVGISSTWTYLNAVPK